MNDFAFHDYFYIERESDILFIHVVINEPKVLPLTDKDIESWKQCFYRHIVQLKLKCDRYVRRNEQDMIDANGVDVFYILSVYLSMASSAREYRRFLREFAMNEGILPAYGETIFLTVRTMEILPPENIKVYFPLLVNDDNSQLYVVRAAINAAESTLTYQQICNVFNTQPMIMSIDRIQMDPQSSFIGMAFPVGKNRLFEHVQHSVTLDTMSDGEDEVI